MPDRSNGPTHGRQWRLFWWVQVIDEDGTLLWEGRFRGYMMSVHHVIRMRALMRGFNPAALSIVMW